MDRYTSFMGNMFVVFLILVVLALAGCRAVRTIPYESICPVTRISDNARCLDCHYVQHNDGQRPKWMVKPNATETLPDGFTWMNEEGRKVGRLLLEDIDSGPVERVFDLLRRHNANKLVIELQSPGGVMFEMLRIVGLMCEWKNEPGHIIETRVYGGACSAALIVFANGSIGHRYASRGAMLMWHKIRMANASENPDAQKVLDKLNGNANSWLSKRCKLSVEELETKIRDGDWWMTADEAVEAGIADGFV